LPITELQEFLIVFAGMQLNHGESARMRAFRFGFTDCCQNDASRMMLDLAIG